MSERGRKTTLGPTKQTPGNAGKRPGTSTTPVTKRPRRALLNSLAPENTQRPTNTTANTHSTTHDDPDVLETVRALKETVTQLTTAVAGLSAQHANTATPGPSTTQPKPSHTVTGEPAFADPSDSLPQRLDAAPVGNNEVTARADPVNADFNRHNPNTDGELPFLTNIPSHTNVMFTGGLKAGDTLPQKLKLKIWSHKYIDFYDILHPYHQSQYTMSVDATRKDSSLQLTAKPKRSLNTNEWIDAWQEYMAVYTLKHPNQLQYLFTYGRTIRTLMRSGQNWSWYDKQFRIAREITICDWATLRVDLHLAAAQPPQTSDNTFHPRSGQQGSHSQGSYNQGSNNQVPPGYCFKYHSPKERCPLTQCPFKHLCPRCNQPHPAFMSCNNL